MQYVFSPMLTLRLEFCILPNWVYIGLKAKRTSGIRNAIHHMVTWLGKKSLITVLACCAGLAGCGGGSGNSSPAVGNPDPISPNPPAARGQRATRSTFPHRISIKIPAARPESAPPKRVFQIYLVASRMRPIGYALGPMKPIYGTTKSTMATQRISPHLPKVSPITSKPWLLLKPHQPAMRRTASTTPETPPSTKPRANRAYPLATAPLFA